MIVLGKTESQDTYVVFTGTAVMLTRSVRRVSTDWKCHLGFYLHFNAPTWKFKTGFGGRVVPKKRAVEGISASFQVHDAEAEAVKNKAAEEKLEEREMVSMGHEDKTFDPRDKAVAHESAVPRPNQLVALDIPEGPSSFEVMRRRADEVVVDSVFDDDAVDASFLATMEDQVDLTHDGGQAAPVTPPVGSMQLPPTPRHPHSTRMHESQEDADHEAKKARVANQKKQKINQLMQEHEAMIRVVKVGTDEFAKMHDYSTELDMSVDVLDDEYWCDEDQVVPDALWSNLPLDKPPPNPEFWVDQLADEIEVQRLLEMGVLQKREECSGNLTARFAYDWRVKQHRNGQQMWMRRSRFVAREFVNVKRHDTYSPASGSHTANLVPLFFLKMMSESLESGSNNSDYDVTLASLDIKDAFLQVPQEEIVGGSLYGKELVIRRNLPGQRLGAKAWYWYFRNYVAKCFECEWCSEQPCLARCTYKGIHNVFMIRVDDLLFAGSSDFWNNKFLPAMTEGLKVSHSELKENGSSISFLKRRLVKLEDGLMIVPGTTVEKVVSCFEKHFGSARGQKVPCDAGIQNEDHSQSLSLSDSKAYRSVIGCCSMLRVNVWT